MSIERREAASNSGNRPSAPAENETFCDISVESAFNRQTTLKLTRPYDSPIFNEIHQGNVSRVIELLRTQQASVNDVDPYGLGLLYVSFLSGVRDHGADIHGTQSMDHITATRIWAWNLPYKCVINCFNLERRETSATRSASTSTALLSQISSTDRF
jgi:hypothetical protein